MINIKNFAEAIGKATGVTTDQANLVIKETVECIANGVNNGETINVSGLGFFKKVMRKGRVCRNPMTRELMKWEDVPVIKYHVASRFSRIVRDAK